MRFLCLLLSLLPLSSTADEALWQLIGRGGQVLMIRHAVTTPGVGDPPGFRLEDCATQRNLTDEGRAGARSLGAAFAARKVPVGAVLASPWCRCIETARLAFGRSENWDALANLFGRPERAAAQVRALRPRIAAHRGKDNLVLVTHGSTTLALTGVSPATTEVVVLTPGGKDGFSVAGRLLASLPAPAQPSPHAIDIPPWFSETLLEFPEDVREAAREGKRMLVYFGQDGCPYCTRLMQDNFTQKDLVDLTRRHYVAVALNIWGDRKLQWTDGRVHTEKTLAQALRVQFTPTILLLDEKGAVAARLNGYYPPRRFAAALAWGAGTAGRGQRFDEYMSTVAKDAASPALHEPPFLKKGPVQLKGAKPVAVLFETPHCAGCDELHKEAFPRPEVRRLLQRFDVYRGDMALARSLRVSYTPSIVLFDGGKEALRIEAYVRPFHLASALDYVASGAWRSEPSFQRYLQARAGRMRGRGEQVELWN